MSGSSIVSSIRARFASRMAGSTAFDDWQGVVIFRPLYRECLQFHIPNQAKKTVRL